MMHGLVKLAKQSVDAYVLRGERISPPHDLSPEMAEQAGVFVCLKKHGELRGCIGTFSPCTGNIAEETIRNAIAAATQDPRFRPVGEEDLGELEYSVDVLSPPEKVDDMRNLDPKAYGIIVCQGMKRGLLLPDLEGITTVDEQIKIARMKAGIGADEPVEIFRFTVRRYR
jgi:AmmeMemoRadiSam system protein A